MSIEAEQSDPSAHFPFVHAPVPLQTVFVSCVVGAQVLNGMTAKSFVDAVNDPELRVCGTNVLMQPLNPIPAKSTPTSYSPFVSTVPVSIPETFVASERQAQPPQPIGPRVESLNACLIAFVKVSHT